MPFPATAPIASRPHPGSRHARAVRATFAALLAAAGIVALPARLVAADGPAEVPEVGECEASPELASGATGTDVRCLQYALIMLGYPVKYTGTFDRATVDAVTAYQRANPPLRADGRAGEQTLTSLGIRIGDSDDPPAPGNDAIATSAAGATGDASDGQRDEEFVELPTSSLTCLADAHLKVGSKGASVTCLQKRLAELGMYRGSANGTFDQALADAVTSFQAIRPPLGVDGIAGPRTLAALGIWSGISPGAVPAGTNVGTGPFPAGQQPEPNWNLTADGIPRYGNRTACTPAQAAIIAYEFGRDGADVATQQWAVYIASREGGCRHDAVNQNPATKDDSHCTFQINALSGVFGPHGELGRRGWSAASVKVSLQACADAASDLWVFCGRGPWTPPYSCKPPWGAGLSTANVPEVPTTVADPSTSPGTATTTASNPTAAPPDDTVAPTPTIPVPTVSTAPPTVTTTTSPSGSPDGP